MRTDTLVRGSADVVTVVRLRKHDVYKRLDKEGYGDTYVLRFGIVTDVLYNGEDTAITAIEFRQAYAGQPVVTELKVFGTNSDLKLFYAEPEEITTHLGSIHDDAIKTLEKAQQELARAQVLVATVEQVRRETGTLQLMAPITSPTVEVEGSRVEPQPEEGTDEQPAF